MNIPEEAIEKAADAVWYEIEGYANQGAAEKYARAALTAAAPHLMAMALREAADEIDIGQDTANHHATVAAETWLLGRANELEAL